MMSNKQKNWDGLIERMGSEEAARKELARKLRLAADQVESGGYPDVYGCNSQSGNLCDHSFIEEISVTLSHPWPG